MTVTHGYGTPSMGGSRVRTPAYQLFHDWVFVTALAVLMSFAAASVGAEWITVHLLNSSPLSQDLQIGLLPLFSPGHPLGSDELGRDMLARTLFAGQVSLAIGFSVALLQSILGVVAPWRG